MTSDFDEFLKREKASSQNAVDMTALRSEWLHEIDCLYHKLKEYLRDYEDQGLVSTSLRPLYLNEDAFGSYETKELSIKLGASSTVRVVPVARLVIGSMGRVDVIGNAGRSRFVRLRESMTERNFISVDVRIAGRAVPEPRLRPDIVNEPVVWRIVEPPPKLAFQELTKGHFLSLLVKVSDG